MRRVMAVLIVSMWATTTAPARAATDDLVTVTLRDGSRLVGRIVAEDETSVRIRMSGGSEVTIPVGEVVSRRGGDARDTETAGIDPNYSRLLFAPTARPLQKGDGYFADYELLFPGVAYGITDNISLSGGFSVIPGLGLGEQLFYVSPKIGLEMGGRASVAVGALFAGVGGNDFDDGESASIGFAVGTFGDRKRSVTLGVGLGDTSGESTDAVPILMAGGTATLSRRVAVVGETWMFLGDDFRLEEQPFGIGLRLFGDRLSADLGVVLSGELIDEGFPIPWLSVTYHFGKNGVAR